MPPLPCMQAALERSSNPNLTLERENFINWHVSLLWLLSTIFTGAIGRSLHHCQPLSRPCCSYIDQNNFCSKQNYFDYLPDPVIPDKPHHQKVLLLHWCTLGFLCTFIIHFADDPEHCNWKWRVSSTQKSPVVSNDRCNIQGLCSSTIYFHHSLTDCL